MNKPVFGKLISLMLLFLFILSSCSVDKRLYRSGYHVHSTNQKHSAGVSTSEKKIQKQLNVNALSEKEIIIGKPVKEHLQTDSLAAEQKIRNRLKNKTIAKPPPENDTHVSGTSLTEKRIAIDTSRIQIERYHHPLKPNIHLLWNRKKEFQNERLPLSLALRCC